MTAIPARRRTTQIEARLARRLGVGRSDVLALQFLVDNDTAGTVGLGHALGIRSASATALVDRPQAAGHHRRTPQSSDGRRVALALTDSARAEVIAVLTPLRTAIDAEVSEFTPDDQLAIGRFMHRATEVMLDYAGSRTGPAVGSY